MKTTAMAAGLALMLLASRPPYALSQDQAAIDEMAVKRGTATPEQIARYNERLAAKAATKQQPAPSVINRTYTISDRFGSETYTLHEEEGTLVLDVKGKPKPYASVEYAKVKYIPVPISVFCGVVESDGGTAGFILRSEAEAKEVAEYIAHRAGLELVVDVWRVRKPFQCPEPAQAGCLDFKELLDHDDPEIVGYFYHLNLATFACFSGDERRFFILQYAVPYLPSSVMRFFQKVFKNGQENSSTLEYLRWRGDVGEIFGRSQQTKKWQEHGSIDSSSLSFQDKWTNKVGSTTDYTLNVRWATGRYTENYLWKDDKGKTVASDSFGMCVKLDDAPVQIPKGATLAEPTKP